MVYIDSAFWGDEQSTKNVTQVLRDKINGDRLYVEKVDDSLIPAFTVTPKTNLTTDQQRLIRQKAEELCGGADQKCIEVKVDELTQQALLAKANMEIANATPIKGKRLTVRVKGNDGKITEKVIPENGTLELTGLLSMDPRKLGQALPTMEYVKQKFIDFTGVSIATFVWVFGIAATYTLFLNVAGRYIAPILAIIAFLIPGSGYVMILGYFIITSFVENYTA